MKPVYEGERGKERKIIGDDAFCYSFIDSHEYIWYVHMYVQV